MLSLYIHCSQTVNHSTDSLYQQVFDEIGCRVSFLAPPSFGRAVARYPFQPPPDVHPRLYLTSFCRSMPHLGGSDSLICAYAHYETGKDEAEDRIRYTGLLLY